MKQIIKFLKKVFCSLDSRTNTSYWLLAYYLTKVAKCNSYIETFCKNADTLHTWLKQVYEEDLKRAFELEVRKAIRSLNVRCAELIFDFTKEPFYGKTRNLHIINCKKSKPYKGEFHFITCCLLSDGKQIPLMALPVRYGDHTKLAIELLSYCKTLFPKIRFVLFDRGFYSGELIDYLSANKLKYHMLVPKKKGVLLDFLQQTEWMDKLKHPVGYTKEKSKWRPKTTIVACKEISGYDWLFATNIKMDKPEDYVKLYKRRWQIETNYRVEDEAKIKSKSCNYLIRYFYFLISNLLHLYWIINKRQAFYAPFKKYIDIVQQEILYMYQGIDRV